MRVHQFHPVLASGDAMSNHVFALERKLREWGHQPASYAIEAKPGVTGVLPYRRLFRTVRPEDLLILHYSMGHEVFDQLVKLPGRKVLVYHNVTPPEFFSGINPHAAAFAQLGRTQLRSLVGKVDLAVGVSEYNRRELADAGFEPTATVPILIDWDALAVPPDEGVLAAWGGGARGAGNAGNAAAGNAAAGNAAAGNAGRTTLLFVGRVSPNKRHDDLIRMLAYYRRCIDPKAHLLLVGSYRDQPQYHARVASLARELGLADAVTFTGPVPVSHLVAYYASASVFISLSEHEGFCVPLLEAMHFRLPIVAYDAAAVGETAGDAAILLPRKDLAEAAEACALAIESGELRRSLIAAGERRVADFASERVALRTREVLGL